MKKIVTLISLVGMLLLLVGCHGSARPNGFVLPETFDENKKYEITFWAKNDSNVNQIEVYEKAIEDFENYYPNIKVNLVKYNDYTKIYNDVITNIATNTTPNVCITYPDHIATYLTGINTVTPLDELIEDERFGLGGKDVKFDSVNKEEMIKAFLDEGYINGKCYAIPFMRSSEALYINKDLVEKLGYEIPDKVTWDFVWEVSEKAMAKDEEGNFLINGQKIMIPFIYKSTDNMMIQMLRQLDGGYTKEDGTIELFNDDTRNILKEIASHVSTGAFSTFKISSYPANFLNAGQCIFAIDSTAGSTWMGSDAPLLDIPEDQLVKFETVVKEIPQYNIDKPKMISQGPSICIFNKEDNGETLASWLFAQFLLTDDVQIAYSKTEGYLPVTTKAQENADYIDYLNRSGEDNDEHYHVKIDATNLIKNNIENTFVTPVFNGSASVRTASGQLIEETCKTIRRKKTFDDAYIDGLYKDMTSLYRLNQLVITDASSKELGPLPTGSKALIISLVGVWIIIGIFAYKKRNEK